jgi:xanthine dehydrogenase accessory factor
MIKHRWQQAVAKCQEEAKAFCLVTIVGTTGSTPREGGSKMVVTEADTFDSIGGGKLELLATEEARMLLLKGKVIQQIHHFPLAAQANQCCGGSVTVLIEVFPRTAIELVLFGAGHVAKSLVAIVSELDIHLTWVDNRQDLFPEVLSPGVEKVLIENPEEYVKEIAGGAYIVVLTHDHALDYRLVKEILHDDTFAYLGLIGSDTKAKRFRKRLQHDGFDQRTIGKVNCPVGLLALQGKLPMEVAVSIAAQVLSLMPVLEKSSRRGLSWQEIKEVIGPAQV